MVGVLAKHQPQVPLASDQHPVQALAAALATQRSAIAFAGGARTGVLMIRIPAAANTASKAAVNLAPRSRIKSLNPGRDPRGSSGGCGPAGSPTHQSGGR
jgi:hypothetical protein